MRAGLYHTTARTSPIARCMEFRSQSSFRYEALVANHIAQWSIFQVTVVGKSSGRAPSSSAQSFNEYQLPTKCLSYLDSELTTFLHRKLLMVRTQKPPAIVAPSAPKRVFFLRPRRSAPAKSQQAALRRPHHHGQEPQKEAAVCCARAARRQGGARSAASSSSGRTCRCRGGGAHATSRERCRRG